MTNSKITTMKAAIRAVGLPDFLVWRGSFMVRRRAQKRAALVGDKPGILRASAKGAGCHGGPLESASTAPSAPDCDQAAGLTGNAVEYLICSIAKLELTSKSGTARINCL